MISYHDQQNRLTILMDGSANNSIMMAKYAIRRCYARCGISILLLCLLIHSSNNYFTSQYPQHSTSTSYYLETTASDYPNDTLLLSEIIIYVSQKNGNNTVNIRPPRSAFKNVTLTFPKPRTDRMGSRLLNPLGAWIIAWHHGWKFCLPPEPMAIAFSFPLCPIHPEMLDGLQRFEYQDEKSTDAAGDGVFYIHPGTKSVWDTIFDHEKQNHSLLDDGWVEEWRRMILASYTRPEMDELLWLHKESIRIAAHVRRGDIRPGHRNDKWIGDSQIIALIEMAIYRIQLNRGKDVKIEVHLFSESYGATNWTKYGDLVDKFHLAPEGSNDIDLNVRDWKHFVLADVLIVGGTFSHVAAFARSAPSIDGLPLTLNWRGLGFEMRRWTHFSYAKMEKEWRGAMLVDFPHGTITAKVDGDVEKLNIETMVNGLCNECKSSKGFGALDCADKIQQYAGGSPNNVSYSVFLRMQRKVSDEYKHCSECNPDTCRVIVDGQGTFLPIESIIEAQYVQS